MAYKNKAAGRKGSKKDTDELRRIKLDKEISNMKGKETVNELKEKSLPVFGTLQQKRERLKNYYGISIESQSNTMKKAAPSNKIKKDSTRAAIDQINKNREKRRRKMEEK